MSAAEPFNPPYVELAAQSICWNCSARYERPSNGEKVEWITTGNSTEQALLKFLLQHNIDGPSYIDRKADNILDSLPFNSKRKRATTAILLPDGNTVRIFTKGAPEICVELCDYYIDNAGN